MKLVSALLPKADIGAKGGHSQTDNFTEMNAN